MPVRIKNQISSNPYPGIVVNGPRNFLCDVCDRTIPARSWNEHERSKKHVANKAKFEHIEKGLPDPAEKESPPTVNAFDGAADGGGWGEVTNDNNAGGGGWGDNSAIVGNSGWGDANAKGTGDLWANASGGRAQDHSGW